MSVPIGHFRNWCPPPQDHYLLMHLCCRGARNTTCWWWKMPCAARRNPSHNRSTSPPSLATLDTINQRFATGTKKKAIGWILFVCQIWAFFSWHRSDHCNCIVLPCCLSLNQPGYILQAKLKFVKDLFVCSSWPLPNQIKLKLTTNSKLIEASDVVLNWLWFLKMQRDHLAFLCSTSRLVDWFEMQCFPQISARSSDHKAEVSTKFVDQVEALNQVWVLNA